MEISPELAELIHEIQEKYVQQGEDPKPYIEGLRWARPVTYWDYLSLDALLALQQPRSELPDEMIFIIYHQITELFFKLIQIELDHILDADPSDTGVLLQRLQRINSYFKHLATSFEVMVLGMEIQQFLRFRTSLLPASGFQSAQFRMIEMKCTDLIHLVAREHRDQFADTDPIDELYPYLYWKYGNRELDTGEKTLTLRMFEDKYDTTLRQLAQNTSNRNLNAHRRSMSGEQQNAPEVVQAFKTLDFNANIYWRLSHYKAAARYFSQEQGVTQGTGGTNWQQYLPPRIQQIIFFPELWSETEKAEWGRGYMTQLFAEKVEGFWEETTFPVSETPH